MVDLPPIDRNKIAAIQEELSDFPEIEKSYGEWLGKALTEHDPRTYPIIKQFLMRNYEYLKLIDKILGETSSIEGFKTIIKHSKNKAEFYDEFSVLKFGAILKDMGYAFKFIPPSDEPRPDVLAKIRGKTIFFEVKHLRNVDEAMNALFDYFNEYPSKFVVSIFLDSVVTLPQIQESIETIRTIIETKKEENFPQKLSLGYADVEIRLSTQASRTPLVVSAKLGFVPFERTRFKIETTFGEAMEQLKSASSTSPCFVVYDVDNWKIEFEDMAPVFYGDTITDVTLDTLKLQQTLYKLKKEPNLEAHHGKITKAFVRNFYDMLKANLLIPQFSYSLQNGLFFSDKSNHVNGVIAFRGNKQKLFPNPFVTDEKLIDYYELKKIWPA